MSDETPRPIMPKRPYVAAKAAEPAVVKPLSRKTGKRKIKEIEEESYLITMEEKACALLSVERGVDFAAKTLKISPEEVNAILDSPPVRWFMKELQREDLINLSKERVKNLRKVGITRTAIEERLMELMMLDPDRTKGNIDGQVKAAAALADKFGYAGKEDPLAGKSPAELEAMVHQGAALLKGSSVN